MPESLASGHFGPFGGRYVPETVIAALDDLIEVNEAIAGDADFWAEFRDLCENYAGRPTPLTHAKNLSRAYGGAQIWLKREDLLHTGAHKLNNALGQLLLAERLGKSRIIAETGAGQHGVATATACALFGKECVVYMGEEDTRRQAPNVFRMRMLGATIVPVTSGAGTLKDATSEAIRDWVTNVRSTHYVIGSTVGPHPYPTMVRNFHRCIGDEVKVQIETHTGRQPNLLVACVGGGSNAMGLFYPYLDDGDVEICGVEAGGCSEKDGDHCATLSRGRPGVLHGSMSYLLQNAAGQVQATHSISAGLDYPGVGPEHAFLRERGRARYLSVSDGDALEACKDLCRLEGILPALETSHALAAAKRLAPGMAEDAIILVNLSGRGDKDLSILQEHLPELRS